MLCLSIYIGLDIYAADVYIVIIHIKLTFDFSHMFKFRFIHYAKQISLSLSVFFFACMICLVLFFIKF